MAAWTSRRSAPTSPGTTCAASIGASRRARVAPTPDLIDGSLSEPEVEGAVIERIGEDQRYRSDVGALPRIVIEPRYAVFPQRSGPLSIPPLAFEGRVHDSAPPPRGARQSPFSGFGQRSLIDDFFAAGSFGGGFFEDFLGPPARSIRAHSAGVTLDVQPRPEGASDQWWSPVRHVELVEEWGGDPTLFRVGEPVTRTLAIRATGLSGAQLPELPLPPVEGAKQYNEPAVDETRTIRNETVAIKAWKTALIPTREGPLSLPEITLEWWDTETDEARTARIAARVVQVLPDHAPIGASQGAPTAGSEPAAVERVGEEAIAAPGAGAAWTEVAGGATVAGLALSVGFVAVRRRRDLALAPDTSEANPIGASAPERPASAERALRRACEVSDPIAASLALRDVARSRWPDDAPKSAAAWGARLASPQLQGAVAELDRVRYSGEPAEWNGDVLWQAYRLARKSSPGANRRKSDRHADSAPSDPSEVLPSLYPRR